MEGVSAPQGSRLRFDYGTWLVARKCVTSVSKFVHCMLTLAVINKKLPKLKPFIELQSKILTGSWATKSRMGTNTTDRSLT